MAKAPEPLDPFSPKGERHYFWKGVLETLLYIFACIGFFYTLEMLLFVGRAFCGR